MSAEALARIDADLARRVEAYLESSVTAPTSRALITDLIALIPGPPTDDERETVDGCPLCWDLDAAVCNNCGRGLSGREGVARALRAASTLGDRSGEFEMSELAAGYYADAVVASEAWRNRHRGSITEAVERAVGATWAPSEYLNRDQNDERRSAYAADVRRILEAAEAER